MKNLLPAGLAVLGLLPSCFAEQVTYSYTGSAFAPGSYSGTFTSAVETNITATLTFAAPLGPNFTEAEVSPLSFSISDGSTTLTNLSPNIVGGATYLDFGTDASGNINVWNMTVVQSTGGGTWLELLTEVTADESVTCGGGPVGSDCSPVTGLAYVEYSSNQPSWTESEAAPEPSTFALFAVTLAVLAPLLRKRLNRKPLY